MTSPYERVIARHKHDEYLRYISYAKTPEELRRQMIERFEIARASAMNQLASYEATKAPQYLKKQAKAEAAIYERELYFLSSVHFEERPV